jgi:putative membrane protein insertion efficiency factor
MLDRSRPTPDPPRPGPIARALLFLVRGYRTWISPVLPPSCRFEPSCSAYALDALSTHGAVRGTWLTVRRLLRCGPWHPGGWDPVPPKLTKLPTEVAAPEATTGRAPAEGTRLRWQGAASTSLACDNESPAGATASRAESRETRRTRNRPDEPENSAHQTAAEE